MINKVLIITYYWPPSGGAGVQRWLKFAKYLPEYGWEPVILTVDPRYAAYPLTDNTLASEIPDRLKIYKTLARDYFALYGKDRSKIPYAGFANKLDNSFRGKLLRFIRGNFFIPDPRRGWNKYAFKKACELIETEGIKYVVTTSPPHSTQLIGLNIKKKYPRIKWLADLRDAWTDIYYYDLFYPLFISRLIDGNYERKVLRKADRIITVGNNLSITFRSKAEGTESKISVIPNGYDEKDFEGISLIKPERFTITYVGTLTEAYPIGGLLSSLGDIEKEGGDFLLRFGGIIPDTIREKITSFISSSKTEFIPYLPHHEAIRLMAESSLLLLIIPSTKENKSITPGKVFEYIAACKPILYIGPQNGDAAIHLERCGQTVMFSGHEADEIAAFIRSIMTVTDVPVEPHPEYSRKNLTLQLAGIMNNA